MEPGIYFSATQPISARLELSVTALWLEVTLLAGEVRAWLWAAVGE